MKKLFVDSDTILDLLAGREPFLPSAAELFSFAEKGEVSLFVSPLIYSNVYYILRKLKTRAAAVTALRKLNILISILNIGEKEIKLALLSDFIDLEDAIHYYTAKEHGMDAIITRNAKDYRKGDIIACTAEECIRILKSRRRR